MIYDGQLRRRGAAAVRPEFHSPGKLNFRNPGNRRDKFSGRPGNCESRIFVAPVAGADKFSGKQFSWADWCSASAGELCSEVEDTKI